MNGYRVICAPDGLFYPQHKARRDLSDFIFFRPKWVFFHREAVASITSGLMLTRIIYERDPECMARFSMVKEAEDFILTIDGLADAYWERDQQRQERMRCGVQ